MLKNISSLPLSFTALALLSCGSPATTPTSTPSSGSAGSSVLRPGAGAAGSTSTPGTSTVGGATTGATAPGATAGALGKPAGAAGTSAAAGGAASATAGASATTGSGAAGGGAVVSGPPPAPTKRAASFKSLAPAMGMPLDKSKPGAWTFNEEPGAVSRDGSPAGFYYKVSKTGDKNLLIYLVGGGVCPDPFFCNMNPKNKNESLTAENVGAGIGNLLGADAEPQDPSGMRWQSGVFKDDPTNPVKDWNMVFIPYVTGDVFFGSKPDGTVPEVDGKHQFVGKINMQKFIARIVPTFADAQTVVVSGSSAGGIGALLNYTYIADGFIDQNKGARVLMVDDAGPFFDDKFLEVCIQQRYRDLFGLNASFPEDCAGCTDPSGGKLASGVLTYLATKYPEGVLGALIDSDQDEIMKFFFSEGQENCAYINDPIGGLLAYPADRYPAALKNLVNELVPAGPTRISTYIWSGDLHQNLFQTATDDRFYKDNGLGKTPAAFLASLIQGNTPEHLGLLKQ